MSPCLRPPGIARLLALLTALGSLFFCLPSPSLHAAGIPSLSRTIHIKQDQGHGLEAVIPLHLGQANPFMRTPFSIRKTRIVTGASLHLTYRSERIDKDGSRLRIGLNRTHLMTLPLTADGRTHRLILPLDPRLFLWDNLLTLRLLSPEGDSCRGVPFRIFPASGIFLHYGRLPLAPNLAFLPEPFVDRRSPGTISLPVVFLHPPSTGTLRAAMILASWFGTRAKYREITFPVVIGRVPKGNALVFVTGTDRGAIRSAEGPGAKVVPNPGDPSSRLLVFSEKQGALLPGRVQALIRILGGETTPPALGESLRSPFWLSIGRPVELTSLAADSRLSRKGVPPVSLHVGFELPPGLFTWQNPGLRFHYRLRYDLPGPEIPLKVDVFVNGTFLRTIPLLPGPPFRGALAEGNFFVPYSLLGKQNRITLAITGIQGAPPVCLPRNSHLLRYSLEPGSSLTIRGVTTLLREPSLSPFLHWGFPDTEEAGMEKSALFVEDLSDPFLLEAALDTANLWGRFTGVPVIRLSVTDSPTPLPQKPFLVVVGYARDWTRIAPVLQVPLALKEKRESLIPLMNLQTRVSLALLEHPIRKLTALLFQKVRPGRPDAWLIQLGTSPPYRQLVTLLLFNSQTALPPSLLSRLDALRQDNQDLGNWMEIRKGTKGIGVHTRRTQIGHFVGNTPFPRLWEWFFRDNPLYLLLLLLSTSGLSVWLFRKKIRSLIRRRLRWHT